MSSRWIRSSSSTSPSDVEDLGAARRAELGLDGDQLVLDDGERRGRASAGYRDSRRSPRRALQFLADLVAAERGQALQAQIENGAGLLFGEAIGALGRDLWRGSAISAMSGAMSFGRPGARHQCSRAFAGSGALRISAMTSSILATAIARPTKIWARSRALLSRNLVRRADDFLAEGDEGLDQVLEIELLRPAADQRDNVDAEGRFAAARSDRAG